MIYGADFDCVVERVSFIIFVIAVRTAQFSLAPSTCLYVALLLICDIVALFQPLTIAVCLFFDVFFPRVFFVFHFLLSHNSNNNKN